MTTTITPGFLKTVSCSLSRRECRTDPIILGLLPHPVDPRIASEVFRPRLDDRQSFSFYPPIVGAKTVPGYPARRRLVVSPRSPPTHRPSLRARPLNRGPAWPQHLEQHP